jgi:hypothetical protein
MTAISQSNQEQENKEKEKSIQEETSIPLKQQKIERLLEGYKKFQEDTKTRISFEPNVTQRVVFPYDWYNDFDEVLNEQISVHHKTELEAVEYAEKHHKVRKKIEHARDDESEVWTSTTFRDLRLVDTSQPEIPRFWIASSKNAAQAVLDELARVSIEENWNGDILLEITKKQGSTIYKTKWEVKGSKFAHR